MTRRILIIEDNPDIAKLIQLHARDIDCEADIAGDGAEGLSLFDRKTYDLVLLDLMLPAIDGLTVCQRLRSKPGYIPILMVTSKSSEVDRVVGLELGADDYLTKPFSIPELMARIKAQFRRMEALDAPPPEETPHALQRGELDIDIDKRQVRIANKAISLTAKEFDLLLYFARHPGRVYTRMQLLEEVWGYGYEGYEHTVNSHINRLRAKIESDPTKPRYILTVWGVGYKFAEGEN